VTFTQTVNQDVTTTSVASSAAPSVFGQTVTFMATIGVQSPGAGIPAGVVQFQIDGISAGSPVGVSSSGGVSTASFSTATLAVGTHTITASYSDDGTFFGSSGNVMQTVNVASTSTAVSSSAPSVLGQLVTLTATVSITNPGSAAIANPTGTVIFFDGATSIGQGTLSTNGGLTTASFNVSSLTTGSHPITASYSGDSNFLPSTGASTQAVGMASTATSVTSSASSSVSGQMVAFTATVMISGSSSTTVANPTGTVTFFDNGISLGQGTPSTSAGLTSASFATSGLTVGTHAITASYGGDGNFLTSTGNLTQTVSKANTTLVLLSSAPTVLGQPVSISVTLTVNSPGGTTVANPTGVVFFSDAGTSIGQGMLNASSGTATASFSTSSLSVGSHALTASYAGDANFLASTATQTLTVGAANTSTVVVSSAGPSASGQTVTFTASVSVQSPGAGTLAGTVQFQVDGTNIGSAVNVRTSSGVTTATFATATLAVGAHTITANYRDGGNFASSSAGLKQTVTKASSNTTLASVSPSASGQMITFTANVASSGSGSTAVANPTGIVVFSDAGISIGQGTLASSGGVTVASFSTRTLMVGGHTITASYSGDGNFLPSTTSVTQTVGKANTGTALTSSANPSVWGQSVAFTATISVSAAGSTAVANPTGVVIFSEGGTSVGQGTLSTNGGTTTANFNASNLAVGGDPISAVYSGDGNFLPSTNVLVEQVNKADTSTLLQVSSVAVASAQPITLTASVSPATSNSDVATGTVTFLDGTMALTTVPLSGGMATFTTVALSLGGHSLNAVYSGDANHTASSSSGESVTVGTPNERFVGGLYQTLLQRQPDPGGLAGWTAALDRGVRRSQVALEIEESLEARALEVQALYHRFLHRDADPSGLNTFVAFLGAGITVEEVSTILMGSPEYLQAHGGTNQGFIAALYADTLNRSPDPGGLASYLQALSQGASRQQIAAAIFESTEYLQDLVGNFYQVYLKRAADNAGLNSFVQALRVGATDQEIIAAMLGSDEFFSQT
jgi:hypothetical protein